MLLAGIDHEQRAGELLHLTDAAQVRFELFALMLQADDFLLGQHIELALLLHAVNLIETVHAGADGAEVGQHAAQPAVVDVEHVAALRLGGDGFLSLLLGAHEQNALAGHGQVAHEVVGFVGLAHGLLQVDDVDAVALSEDVLSHLGVPAAGLVTEVHARFQELLHGDNCHLGLPSLFFPPLALARCGHRARARHNRMVCKGA